ncbi:MAG TPA: methyltransferase domain-containing protein [Alphaproteobacteria bacterium]|jgi:SAM-dependent methyltransferase|nr:methyltransferase domain-containing protein [Alphaproteobacteria bacterium]
MESRSHETVVGGQFGSRAEAYLTSAVHARGADLDDLAALVHRYRDARVLDLGCGGGHVTFAVAPHVREVVAYDLSPEMLAVVARTARERGLGTVATAPGVVETLPFADGSFDIVLSRYSAHHWHDFPTGLAEAARVLKPGGAAGFVDAVAPDRPLLDTYFQAIELLRDCSHVRDYSPAEWTAGLARVGLVPGRTKRYRVRLDFASWVARMRTPQVQVDAIRALQATVSAEITGYFETAQDGSFSIDVALFEAAKPAT